MLRYEIADPVLHEYDAGEPGITVPIVLSSGSISRKVEAKFDSGSKSSQARLVHAGSVERVGRKCLESRLQAARARSAPTKRLRRAAA